MTAEERKKRRRATSSRYYRRNRLKILGKMSSYNATRLAQCRLAARKCKLLRLYGMTLETYDEMLRLQKGVCAICDQPETMLRNGKPQSLVVDHCHTSGQCRGLLCHMCNTSLGKMGDSPARLRAAAVYLENNLKKNLRVS